MITIRKKQSLPQIYFDLVRPFQKLYWYVFRPHRPGAKTLIFYGDKVLLVRIGYLHKHWVFPGGGLDKKEDPRTAAVREAQEEAGVDVMDIEFIGERVYTSQYKKVTQHYFTAQALSDDIVIDGQEIIDAGWFSLSALPTPISPRVLEEIELYNNWKYGKS